MPGATGAGSLKRILANCLTRSPDVFARRALNKMRLKLITQYQGHVARRIYAAGHFTYLDLSQRDLVRDIDNRLHAGIARLPGISHTGVAALSVMPITHSRIRLNS